MVSEENVNSLASRQIMEELSYGVECLLKTARHNLLLFFNQYKAIPMFWSFNFDHTHWQKDKSALLCTQSFIEKGMLRIAR